MKEIQQFIEELNYIQMCAEQILNDIDKIKISVRYHTIIKPTPHQEKEKEKD